MTVEEVDIVGPPTSAALRGAGWAEVAAVRSALGVLGARAAGAPDAEAHTATVTSPDGAAATVTIDDGGAHVVVRCGEVLDADVVRAYAIGAVHMALGWVTTERLAVDDSGAPLNLTIRSFGVVRPGEMISVSVEVVDEPGIDPTSGSDAVFAATAAAVWLSRGTPPAWPTNP